MGCSACHCAPSKGICHGKLRAPQDEADGLVAQVRYLHRGVAVERHGGGAGGREAAGRGGGRRSRTAHAHTHVRLSAWHAADRGDEDAESERKQASRQSLLGGTHGRLTQRPEGGGRGQTQGKKGEGEWGYNNCTKDIPTLGPKYEHCGLQHGVAAECCGHHHRGQGSGGTFGAAGAAGRGAWRGERCTHVKSWLVCHDGRTK